MYFYQKHQFLVHFHSTTFTETSVTCFQNILNPLSTSSLELNVWLINMIAWKNRPIHNFPFSLMQSFCFIPQTISCPSMIDSCSLSFTYWFKICFFLHQRQVKWNTQSRACPTRDSLAGWKFQQSSTHPYTHPPIQCSLGCKQMKHKQIHVSYILIHITHIRNLFASIFIRINWVWSYTRFDFIRFCSVFRFGFVRFDSVFDSVVLCSVWFVLVNWIGELTNDWLQEQMDVRTV